MWGLMDRRQHERYDFEGPLSFSWNGPGRVRHRQQGLLRNISGSGVFVSALDSPPDGAPIQFTMSFCPFFANSRLVMQARAQVVRVESAEPIEGRAGFAAAIKTFTLRNDEKKLIERGVIDEVRKSGKIVEKTLMKSRTRTLFEE